MKFLTINSNTKHSFSRLTFCGIYISSIIKTVKKIRNVPPVVHAAVTGRLQCTTGGTCCGYLLAPQQPRGGTGKPCVSGVAVNVLNDMDVYV